MKVSVRYFATVREIVGRNEEDFEVPDHTIVRDFLSILSEKYGGPLRDYVFLEDTGELSPHLNFLIDGQNIVMMEGAQTLLYEGCVFAIIPPVGGGTAEEDRCGKLRICATWTDVMVSKPLRPTSHYMPRACGLSSS